jgi:hypothetical protein
MSSHEEGKAQQNEFRGILLEDVSVKCKKSQNKEM